MKLFKFILKLSKHKFFYILYLFTSRPPKDLPVYNYVSGEENQITWNDIYELAIINGRAKYPTNASIYYPCCFIVKSVTLFSICNFFMHLIPALMIDMILWIMGRKPM